MKNQSEEDGQFLDQGPTIEIDDTPRYHYKIDLRAYHTISRQDLTYAWQWPDEIFEHPHQQFPNEQQFPRIKEGYHSFIVVLTEEQKDRLEELVYETAGLKILGIDLIK
ncbi:MAG: hypothetical protein QM762_12835 [Chryseolinea sp.]